MHIAPDAWAALAGPLVARLALPADDAVVIREWAARGRPLMVRRAGPCDAASPGVPLGLPLPPSMGKRRIGVVVPVDAIVSSEAPPALAALRDVAPETWRATIDALDALARRHRVGCRAFGSLAWQALTGLTYLSPGSDLDLLFELPAGSAGGREALAALLDGIATCDAAAPMRIDGELIRTDGAGANWREWHAARGEHDEIVAKTAAEVVLMTPRAFLEGAV
nr:malonate decarboxylase holo-[acyl-carrier-protein] synthase [Burkholderia perseverans]